MADENRFAGLGDQLDEEEDSNQADSDEQTHTSDKETDVSNGGEGRSEEEGPEAGPAFGFDATTPKSIYVRQDTVELLEDAEFSVESLLRQEYGIRNMTGREFHDAMVHILTGHVDEIAERIHDVREDH
jgi:hypothetical protein